MFWTLKSWGLVSGKHRASAAQKNLQKEAEKRESMTPACVASRPEEEAAGSVPSSLKVAGEQSDPRLSPLQATRLLDRVLGAPRPPGVGLSATLRSSQGMAMRSH